MPLNKENEQEYIFTPMEIYQSKEIPKGATSITFDLSSNNNSPPDFLLYEQSESDLTLQFIQQMPQPVSFLSNLEINPFNCWIFHEIPTQKLIPDFNYSKPGDIDLIIGNFHDDKRTPDFSFITAIEIKVRKFAGGELKPFPSGRGTTQAKNLIHLGCDKTYLFHFFVQEPTPVKEGYSESWNAIHNTDFLRSVRASSNSVLSEIENKGYGYGYVGWGQAYGASVSDLGGLTQEILIPAPLKPLRGHTEATNNRKSLEKSLLQYIDEKYSQRKPLIIKI